MNYVRAIAVITIFTLVAFLGGFVKLGGAASIALDSWASFFVAAFFGPWYGGLVGFFAHILSAGTGGFPFGPPVHAMVAVLQLMWALVFGFIARRSNNILGLVVASIVAVGLNGLVAPYLIGFAFPPLLPVMKTLVPILLAASFANVVLAAFVLLAMRRIRKSS